MYDAYFFFFNVFRYLRMVIISTHPSSYTTVLHRRQSSEIAWRVPQIALFWQHSHTMTS